MEIFDLSPEIAENMQVYKNDLKRRPKIFSTRALKDGANESRLEIDTHTGSHVDAPSHFLENSSTIDSLTLDKFMGKCIVLDFTETRDSINDAQLNKKIKNKKEIRNMIVLLKTKKIKETEFNLDFTYLGKSGAEFLASASVKAVGVDSLGVERNQPNHETHKILLTKNIPIFEGLDLTRVKQGNYFFYGFPLKIKNGDGSPVRAVLVK